MEAETLDLLVRTRPTILEMLEDRGFDVESYKGISPQELIKMATTNSNLLLIQAERDDDEGVQRRIVVLYWLDTMRLKVESEVNKLWDTELTPHYDPASDELFIVINEPIHDAFHLSSKKQWSRNQARVNFFPLKQIVSNPARHFMVPPHRKLSKMEMSEVMSSLHMKSKNEFPHIKFHEDIQARILGLVPGDVVEIKRPSETAGESLCYRVCSA